LCDRPVRREYLAGRNAPLMGQAPAHIFGSGRITGYTDSVNTEQGQTDRFCRIVGNTEITHTGSSQPARRLASALSLFVQNGAQRVPAPGARPPR
jgi:hypothetical protein